ncbi:MAG: ATP-binding cassette domain-containing protein [Acidobacteriaceae bacterium]
MPSDILLEAHDLVKEFGSVSVIRGVSLTIRRGETLGLVGESGSGKSTVARLLLRLLEPTSGRILFHELSQELSAGTRGSVPGSELGSGSGSDWGAGGRVYSLLDLKKREMRRLRRRLSMVFQDPFAALNPRMTVREILSEPFLIHREQPAGGLSARLDELLSEVGLEPDTLRRYPHEFSGGQRQRINIARAIALRPELLVLDEPVSALDVSVGAQVINLLRDLQQRYGLTYLFISHSMPLVRYLCHRIAVMQGGRIVETGGWREVCDAPREPYTRRLLAATPLIPGLEPGRPEPGRIEP